MTWRDDAWTIRVSMDATSWMQAQPMRPLWQIRLLLLAYYWREAARGMVAFTLACFGWWSGELPTTGRDGEEWTDADRREARQIMGIEG